MYFVYFLRCIKDNSFYVGFTADLKRRISEHNKGLSSFTRKKRPLVLEYVEAYRLKSTARKREMEMEIKRSWSKKEEVLKRIKKLSPLSSSG